MDRLADHFTAFVCGTGILELLKLSRVRKAIATSELSLLDLVAKGGSKFLFKELTKMTGWDQRFLVLSDPASSLPGRVASGGSWPVPH
jgi:hypothetical protein